MSRKDTERTADAEDAGGAEDVEDVEDAGDTEDTEDAENAEAYTVTVRTEGETTSLSAPGGAVLRDVLRAAGLSPHSRAGRRLNCGGRGVCATCGVRLLDPPDPEHWHDRLAARFGYPRLSCQLRVTRDLTVEIPDKLVWGDRSGRDGIEARTDAGTGK